MNLTQELINVLQGIHDGKPWEYRAGENAEWNSTGIHPALYIVYKGFEIRLKPEPVRVPLGPGDVPPGSVFRCKDFRPGIYLSPSLVMSEGVCWIRKNLITPGCETEYMAFADISANWQINRSIPITGKWDANAWEPCWKEVQP